MSKKTLDFKMVILAVAILGCSVLAWTLGFTTPAIVIALVGIVQLCSRLMCTRLAYRNIQGSSVFEDIHRGKSVFVAIFAVTPVLVFGSLAAIVMWEDFSDIKVITASTMIVGLIALLLMYWRYTTRRTQQ